MSARHPLEAYAESYEQMERRGERPAARSVAADIRYNMMPATLSVDTLATLRSDNERLGRERDEARADFAKLMNDYTARGMEIMGRGEALESAEAERDTLLAQVGRLTEALQTLSREMRAALTKEPS